MADQIKMSSAEGPAPKTPKRIEQIEMTTAEGPAQNIFRQNFNIFGKPVPLKTTFSFNTDQAKLTPANNMKNIPTKSSTSTVTISITNSATMKDVTSRDVPEVNKTWTPFNTAMAISKDRETLSSAGQDKLSRNHQSSFLQASTTLVMEMLSNVSSVEFT